MRRRGLLFEDITSVRLRTRSGVIRRQDLPDHAAHGDALDMRGVDVEGIHDPQRITGMVIESVGRIDPHPDPELRHGLERMAPERPSTSEDNPISRLS